MRESWSVHLLHGRGASVVAQGDALGGAAGSLMVLESSGLGCCSYPSKAPSGTRGLGNPAAVEALLTHSRGGPGHGTLR